MFEVNIDFDEASREWRKNKKKCPKGRFEYICNYIHTNGKQCRKSIISSKITNDYIYGFGGCSFVNKYKSHPNRDYFCKTHINRYNPSIFSSVQDISSPNKNA